MPEAAVAADSPRILISYRRDDSSGYAGRIYDRLTTELGPHAVFLDIDGIAPGADFVEAIQKAVAASQVVIAVIGRNWLDIRDESGGRRLDDPHDFVRLEIATALKRGVLVIPALVQDARMPRVRDLPGDLELLARRQAIEISDTRFHEDVERLLGRIRDSGAVPGFAAAQPRTSASVTERRRLAGRGAFALALVLAAAATVWGVVELSRRLDGLDDRPTEPPVVRRFTVEPSHYIRGHVSSVTLTWDVAGAAEISLPPLGSVDARGSRTLPAPPDDTTFMLQARNRVGETAGQAEIDVTGLEEFIGVDAPSPEMRTIVMRWLSDYLRSLEVVGYLPAVRGVVLEIRPGLDNAYFEPQSMRIVIGEPLVGDQDVVLREYTHRVLMGPEFMREGGLNPMAAPDGRAIESGLADYLPASALGDPTIGEVAGPVLVRKPFIRTLINRRRFDEIRPQDPPQRAGEAWGGAFWDMRLALGRATLDPMLLAAWGQAGKGGASSIAHRFVAALLERAGEGGADKAAEIRRVLDDRRFRL